MMNSQTETEKQIAEIIKKHTSELIEEGTSFENISIQTFIRDSNQKAMVIKISKELLPKAQRKYESIMRSIKQKFQDYFVVLVENLDFQKKISWDNKKKIFLSACFPFQVNGIRTDVKGIDEEVVNVLVEKKCTYNENEFKMIETAISGLLGVNVAVGINHHSLN